MERPVRTSGEPRNTLNTGLCSCWLAAVESGRRCRSVRHYFIGGSASITAVFGARLRLLLGRPEITKEV